MEKMVARVVAVKYCDFCAEESEHLSKCAICKKEMCSKEGMKAHTAYSVDIYRYADGARLISHVCKGCSATVFKFAIQALFNDMMGEAPVQRA